MISGFFLGKKYYTRSKADPSYRAWDYTLDHTKSIYPHYFFSCAVFFLYLLVRDVCTLVRTPSWQLLETILRGF